MLRFAVLGLLLTACDKDKEDTEPSDSAACDPTDLPSAPLLAAAPEAGVAEDYLRLPIGTPLSGYTGRCSCFGNAGDVDHRDSAYVSQFNPSVGIQTDIPVKAFWIKAGDQEIVLIKMDLIYSFDGLVEALEDQIGAAVGHDMDGKVVVSTNHSHSSWGDFSDQVTFYLGSDRFNREVFERMVDQGLDVAMRAHDSMQPVKIGVGQLKDWDPEDRVYRDRRDANDSLQFFPDIPAGRYKDPYLTMIRIDTLQDEPLGVLFNFGIHGTTLDGDSVMASIEAPGHVERVFQERFDQPVVVALLQSGTGDASPAGSDDFYARLETVGEYAADSLESLWESTPTAAAPIHLETATRAVPELHDDMRVTRGGTVDLHYTPYAEGLVPDNVVYAEDGSLLSPIDEFNVQYGAAFCGEDPAYLPGFAPSSAFPYTNCVNLTMMMGIITGFFDLTPEEAALPLPEQTKANVTALRMGPLPIRNPDGSTVEDDLFVGFFPGEPTSYFTEQFRRRAASELGFQHTMAVGYSQDHEGYLLIPEDWLTGGYEIDINVWGPLQAEHIMEQLLTMSGEVLTTTDTVEDADPCDTYQPPEYGLADLPTLAPDETPEAGTYLEEPPPYLYSPLYSQDELEAGVVPEIGIPASVPRVQGLVQIAWKGGDPAVDYPDIVLEREEAGGWEAVLTPSGRAVLNGPDILRTVTPDPLAPPEAGQVWTWYAAWQAVDHIGDRAGLPEGTYRFRINGKSYLGGATTWPWPSEDYEIVTPTFEIVPGLLSVAASGADLSVSLPAPARGYRLVGLDGNVRGDNPLAGDEAILTFTLGDGSTSVQTLTGAHAGGRTVFSGVVPEGAVRVDVSDRYGNAGSLEF